MTCPLTIHDLRQIAVPLSRRSAQRADCAAQVQLRRRRLPERPVPARICPELRGSTRAAQMPAGWPVVRSDAEVQELRGGVTSRTTRD